MNSRLERCKQLTTEYEASFTEESKYMGDKEKLSAFGSEYQALSPTQKEAYRAFLREKKAAYNTPAIKNLRSEQYTKGVIGSSIFAAADAYFFGMPALLRTTAMAAGGAVVGCTVMDITQQKLLHDYFRKTKALSDIEYEISAIREPLHGVKKLADKLYAAGEVLHKAIAAIDEASEKAEGLRHRHAR